MDLKGKRILVMGASGKSGRSAALCYAKMEATVLLADADAKELPDLAGVVGIQDMRPRDDAGLLDSSVDLIVTAPGVPLSLDIFSSARERGIPVFGENDLGAHLISTSWNPPPFVCAVTGTDGKSTTTALIDHMARSVGISSVACGNFGTPLSSLVFDPPVRMLSLECSSFQLEPARFLRAHVAMILNLSQDHMDRYATLEDYLHAKLNVTMNQTAEDLFIAPKWILDRSTTPARKIALESLQYVRDEIWFSGKAVARLADYSLPGAHNRINLNFALAALENASGRLGISVSAESIRSAIASFRGLPHRMESVVTVRGIEFVNDSKATTVQAVCSGLTAFAGRSVALLCGGYDKGLDYSELAKFEGVVLLPFGEAGPKIARDTGAARVYATLEEALRAGADLCKSQGQGVVYLGPACASYDAYNSYEERGEHFRSLALGLAKEWNA